MDHKGGFLPVIDNKSSTPEFPSPPGVPHQNTSRCRWSCVKRVLVVAACGWLGVQFARKVIQRHGPFGDMHHTLQQHEESLIRDDWYPHQYFSDDDPVINTASLESNITTKFNLTTLADRTTIFTRGPIIGNVTIASGGTAGDDIEVDVTVFNSTEVGQALQHGPCVPPALVKIHPIRNAEGEVESIGIFAYRDYSHSLPMYVPHRQEAELDLAARPPKPGPSPPPRPAIASIAIRFPDSSSLSKSKDPLHIKSFKSDSVGFEHTVEGLNVEFDEFELVGSVKAKTVSAKTTKLTTVFGGIEGRFSASNLLNIVSTAGNVDVLVDLWAQANAHAKFSATSFGGFIHANVSLLTKEDPSDSGNPPTYIVEANNFDYPTWIVFTEQPLLSHLIVKTFSKFAAASVTLHPVFQGPFFLKSVFSKPTWWNTPGTKDPFGHDRTRVVEISKDYPTYVKGRVYWDGPQLWNDSSLTDKEDTDDSIPVTPGSVELTSIGVPVSLIFG